MAWARYILYFLGVALLMWMLTQLEISFPGSLSLHAFAEDGAQAGQVEYSPLAIIEPLLLGISGLLMLWIARHCLSQRPIAIPFAGLALAFAIRELEYIMNRLLIHNLWLVLLALVAALLITYVYRQGRRMQVAWARVWPSPGIAILFAGAVVQFAFVSLLHQEMLWRAILGAGYQGIVNYAVREFVELIVYLLWLIGTVEYLIQARAIAHREPQPAARRRRQRRRHAGDGQF